VANTKHVINYDLPSGDSDTWAKEVATRESQHDLALELVNDDRNEDLAANW
jgi:hypothetical protein